MSWVLYWNNSYEHVLVLVDTFCNCCLIYLLYTQYSYELQKTFINAISLYYTLHLIDADFGCMLESANFVKWGNDLGCSIHYITLEMYHANGQVERCLYSFHNMLRVETYNRKNKWPEELWHLQNVINQETTQTSPLNFLIGIGV